MENSKKFHKKKLVAGIVLSVLFAMILACGIYLSDYYKADFSEIERVLGKSENQLYEKSLLKEGPKAGAKTGFVFYPGGKVQYNAYEPLLAKLADNGIACFLVKMPFNLAVFNINAAEKILNQFSEIEDWYIGGHSLGGSMAASFLGKNQDDIKGLILLASYSTVDFSNSDIKILSIFGSEDRVLNLEKYAEYKPNLSKNTSEFVIEGGNHAGFGFYGNQEGDGTATISSQEQIEKTAELIAEFVASTTLSNR
jgi:dienelactone hydrolase